MLNIKTIGVLYVVICCFITNSAPANDINNDDVIWQSDTYNNLIYVDDDAVGANDGSSWNNGFRYLQDALNIAQAGDEILVAQGIYYPDLADNQTGIIKGDRKNSFTIPVNVGVMGGFQGIGATHPLTRNIELYETILSGDLDADDVDFSNIDDNSYHVVNITNVEEPSLLEGFTITGGNAVGSPNIYSYGGGIYLDGGACHSIKYCTIIGNYARYGGGGMLVSRCDVKIDNCKFINNRSDYRGGGISLNTTGIPILTNCIFTGNHCNNEGGGLTSQSNTTLINCIFTGNTAKSGAGVTHNWYNRSLTMINCTVVNNTAEDKYGGGVYLSSGSLDLHNSILWWNRSKGNIKINDQVYTGSQPAVITYCCIEGLNANTDGNISEYPMFVDADGPDNKAGTIDDNLRLLSGSSSIDVGDNSRLPIDVTVDVEGYPRIADGTVDMGAYEGGKQGLVLSDLIINVPEGQTNSVSIKLASMPQESVTVSASVCKGDTDLSVDQGQNLIFTPENYQISQDIIIYASQDQDFLDGTAQLCISADVLPPVNVVLVEDDDESSAVIYVDDTAGGANNGMSWADAFTSLQNALETAHDYPQFEAIFVAQGTYYPTIPGGSQEISFDITGLSVIGGFAGSGTVNPDDRDVELYETILSGDIYMDDVQADSIRDLADDSSMQNNSYNVVISTEDCILDGFTVTAGNGVGQAYIHKSGGGFRGGGAVKNCTFTKCYADNGGGISISEGIISDCKVYNCMGVYGGGIRGFAEIRDCQVWENYARFGGGMYLDDSEIFDTVFRDNYAETSGGGLCIHYAEVRLDGCLFINNHCDSDGGGVSVNNCGTCNDKADFYNCKFINNSAGGKGGGYHYQEGWGSSLWNCLFTGNQSYGPGGGVYHRMYAGDQIVNSTFYNNTSSSGEGGIYTTISTSSDGYLNPGIENCILWDNKGISGTDKGNDQISLGPDDSHVKNCCVQGWSAVPNEFFNFGADPLFVNPVGDDGLASTEDDDLRILPGSRCIDTGDDTYIFGNIYMGLDLNGDQRIYGLNVDIGAYEYNGYVGENTLYVDASAPDGGNGYSWQKAFNDLHDALSAAEDGYVIRIAQGTYKPADPNGDPEVSFVVPVSVSIYGGYAGLEEENPAQRSPDKFVTVLSGDLNSNDIGSGLSKSDNSRTVMKTASSGSDRLSVVIDGLTIKSAYSDYYHPNVSGGGLKLSLTVNSVISNCVFTDNFVYNHGGGLFSTHDENLIIEHCTFTECQAISGMGGAIAFGSSSIATVKNCLMYRNYCSKGTISNEGSDIAVINCTLTENSAGDAVGIWSAEGYLELRNSILWEQPTTYAGTGNQVIYPGSNYSINHCIIRNLTGINGGVGNMDRNPFFVDPELNDYHLRSISGRWNPENFCWVKDSVQSSGIDAGSMSSPAGLEPFPNGGVINIGAYGGTEYASKSWFGKDCKYASAGDINGDCSVNLIDFSILAYHWMDSSD